MPLPSGQVLLNEDNIADVQADIEGPQGTPYEGGVFRMKLAIGPDFPNAPPKGYFLTKASPAATRPLPCLISHRSRRGSGLLV